MLYTVTVYMLSTSEDRGAGFANLTASRLGIVLVPNRNEAQASDLREIAGEAWEKVVGIPRRKILRKMGAPRKVILGTTTAALMIESALSPAPSGLDLGVGDSQWIFDNGCESWLISIKTGD